LLPFGIDNSTESALLSKLLSIFIRLQLRCLAFPAGKRRLRTSQLQNLGINFYRATHPRCFQIMFDDHFKSDVRQPARL